MESFLTLTFPRVTEEETSDPQRRYIWYRSAPLSKSFIRYSEARANEHPGPVLLMKIASPLIYPLFK